MKDVAALLFGLGILNTCAAGLAGMIDEERWAKAFTIAALILLISGFIILITVL